MARVYIVPLETDPVRVRSLQARSRCPSMSAIKGRFESGVPVGVASFARARPLFPRGYDKLPTARNQGALPRDPINAGLKGAQMDSS
ncbi:hypothetical protein TNCV_597271 [Trichonephila clavipes]|nr:hypothetical protein TNCV_597271 [Trichonephila clavipes]